jgi:hypothetical protein
MPHKPLAVFPVVLLVLCWGSGCSQSNSKRPGPQLKPTLSVYNPSSTAQHIRIMIEGHEVARIDLKEYQYHYIGLEKVVEPAAVRAALLTSDGWTEEYTTITAGTAGMLDREPCCIISFKFEREGRRPEDVKLFVDNRGGPASVVECGELPMSIAANWYGELWFLAPKQPSNAVIRLDKKNVGTVWSENQANDPECPTRFWLLDTSGQKKYVYRGVSYSQDFLSGPEGRSTRGTSIERKFLHTLPKMPDFFLTTAPYSIQESLPGPFVTKLELLEEK